MGLFSRIAKPHAHAPLFSHEGKEGPRSGSTHRPGPREEEEEEGVSRKGALEQMDLGRAAKRAGVHRAMREC